MPLYESRRLNGRRNTMPITNTELLGMFLNLMVLNAELDVIEDELDKE